MKKQNLLANIIATLEQKTEKKIPYNFHIGSKQFHIQVISAEAFAIHALPIICARL